MQDVISASQLNTAQARYTASGGETYTENAKQPFE